MDFVGHAPSPWIYIPQIKKIQNPQTLILDEQKQFNNMFWEYF